MLIGNRRWNGISKLWSENGPELELTGGSCGVGSLAFDLRSVETAGKKINFTRNTFTFVVSLIFSTVPRIPCARRGAPRGQEIIKYRDDVMISSNLTKSEATRNTMFAVSPFLKSNLK